ncbi:unnamed protein product [Clonostachys rosea f. rosea IK726]|uniref:Uncharacterized protein n=1 Tax=Clonostachys rosea f. rosea IK726 TaxID=1349383 RepID=A0ACA9UFQ4_BIOOC|nr:unnamed protein product [Clonostachys rosea f. rosea IK726]
MAFEGFVVSDWYEHKSGVGSANAGLDVVMPVAPLWARGPAGGMVRNGSVSEARVDDMVKRVVAAAWRFADFDAGTGISFNLTQAHSLLTLGAVEGHVLVKNVKNALPLQNLDSFPFLVMTPCADQTVTGPEIALNGTLTTGGGSDASIGSNIDAPLDAIRRQAYEDDTAMAWDVQSPAPLVNKASEACFVFINAQASESWDRKNLTDSYSDNIVTTVANQCNNTMVIIHTAGVRLVDAWYDHPNVTAIIIGHLPGQDSGRALVEILYGKQSPSGRMPYTVAKKESDYGVTLDPDFPSEGHALLPTVKFHRGHLHRLQAFWRNIPLSSLPFWLRSKVLRV